MSAKVYVTLIEAEDRVDIIWLLNGSDTMYIYYPADDKHLIFHDKVQPQVCARFENHSYSTVYIITFCFKEIHHCGI